MGVYMSINSDITQMTFNLLLALSKEAAIQAHKYIESGKKIVGYCKYPVRDIIFSKDKPEYLEFYDRIHYLKYDIPRYELKDFPKDRIQYGAIFNGYGDDRLNIEGLDEYTVLYEYINNNTDLINLMIEEENADILKYRIKEMTSGIVERYLYSINASQYIPEDFEEKLKPFVAEKLFRYLGNDLKIDIYVPICLATFEDEIIKLSDQVEIMRIPDDIQKSRQQACLYETNNEDWLASCATHMIVIHGYCFKNNKYISINTVTRNHNAYPLHMTDDIMAVIRIVTGFTIGYEQILSFPLNWIDGFCADLTPLYGAKSHSVNAKEVEKMWMKLSINNISSEKALEIQKLYSVVQSCEGDKTKGNLSFALKRLNRCMLRDEEDDMAIDATIGLEALLAGGTKGEITYTISNRMPIVFYHEKNDIYTPKVSRSIMKSIYNYRSKVVHGGTIKEKDKYHEINNSKVEIEKIAVDFLRYTLLFVLHNPEFLDAKKFDEFIDTIIFEKKPIKKNSQKINNTVNKEETC